MSLEVGPIGVVGYGALGIVILLWLVISFRPAGPGREVLEWLGATHLYVALGALFLSLVLQARESGSLVGQIAFGFLLLLFVLGLGVSLVNTVRAMSGSARGGSESATG